VLPAVGEVARFLSGQFVVHSQQIVTDTANIQAITVFCIMNKLPSRHGFWILTLAKRKLKSAFYAVELLLTLYVVVFLLNYINIKFFTEHRL